MNGEFPTLDVSWFTGRPIGQLVNPGAIAFGYRPEWLVDGFNLSPVTVPFREQLHRLRDDAFDHLPGFLADCLPDSWGRAVMQQEFTAAAVSMSPLHMLDWVGRRGIGALQFAPPIQNFDASTTWAEVQPLLLAREAQAVMRHAPPDAFEHLRNAGTAGGAFPKATVALCPNHQMLCGGDVSKVFERFPGAKLGILKLDAEDDPTRPSTDGRLEAAYLSMAAEAGINVPHHEIISHEDGPRHRHHLFVERFDVLDRGQKRLHILSLAGALETFKHLDYFKLLGTVRRLTADHSQIEQAIRRMIFNVRAANADDHGKNHAFAFDGESRNWSLTPAFDLTLNYSQTSTFHGLFPQTFGKSPRLSQLAQVAADYGVPLKQFTEIDETVASALLKWEEFAEAHDVPETDIERARKLHGQMAQSLAAHEGKRRSSNRKRRW